MRRRAFLGGCCVAAAMLPTVPAWAETNTRWPDERQAGPFLIHADFSLDQHANMIRELATLQEDIYRLLHIGPAREHVHVYIFHRKATYSKYLKQYFPTAPSRRALFIKGRGPGMIFAYKNSELDVDLRHEATHALLHSSLPVVPLWLDEGLAEYFEPRPQERLYDNSHLRSIRWALRLHGPPKIERLEQFTDLEEMGKSEYRDAWAWVHFMLHGPEVFRGELFRFLADIESRSAPGVLSRRLRHQMANLDGAFVAHFTSWKR